MTPKEKAKELQFEYLCLTNDLIIAKEFALRAVELRIDAYCCPPVGGIEWAEKKEQYWQEVKQEIEKL